MSTEKVAIWENGREVLSVIETDNVYESTLEWLVDRFEREGEAWYVTSVGRWSGLPMPAEYDEVIFVERSPQ